ncbi:MAG: HAD-IB family phosphatase [Gammaproteobacteria bacterium]|nr:HAD-IB family phosphatase [Gammaproteobacteria bacterium]
MAILNWQMQQPISSVFFDCDGTLTSIEGINQLAELKGVASQVVALTELAMSSTGINEGLYTERLKIILPHETQVHALAQSYIKWQTQHAKDVITILQRLGKTVYILSAGLEPAVIFFGKHLGVPEERIFSVGITFDAQGHYLDFDHTSPLIHHDGKRRLIQQLVRDARLTSLIGDGLNDCVAADIVTRFIGFGGVFFRENIARLSDYYLNAPTLSPLLALLLTASEIQLLSPAENQLYQLGLNYFLMQDSNIPAIKK